MRPLTHIQPCAPTLPVATANLRGRKGKEGFGVSKENVLSGWERKQCSGYEKASLEGSGAPVGGQGRGLVSCWGGTAALPGLGSLVITIGLGGVIVDSGYRGRIWGITMESPWGLWWDFSGTSMGLV